MITLTAKQIKAILREDFTKYVILHYNVKDGETYLCERSNPLVPVARVRRGVLHDFNTRIISKPMVLYEFESNEYTDNGR